MNNKKIFITGGAGFLGSRVAKLLIEKDYRVTVFDNFYNGKMLHLENIKHNPNLKIINGDIVDFDSLNQHLKGHNIIIHLAVLDLRQSIKEPERVNNVIVNGTLNCLQSSLTNKIELFLNCSSSEVFGSAQYIPMDEKHPLLPETPYAAAKVAQDKYVFSFGRTYKLPWITVRPFNMYGPNSHWQGFRGEVIPKMIVKAMNRKPLTLFGDGEQTRDFIYVDEVADSILNAMNNEKCRDNEINVCSGKETSMKKIAELICENFGLNKAEYIKYQNARPGDVRRHLGDNKKLHALFGNINHLPIEVGLKKTIKWFKSLKYDPEELLKQETGRNWE
jgi:UDP-glucose 4-epimerase